MARLTRRQALVGGVAAGATLVAGAGTGYALVEREVLPGRVRLDRALGRCGHVPSSPTASVHVRGGNFASRYRGRRVRWRLVPPHDGPLRDLPVVVVLHGLSGSAASVTDSLALQHYLPDAVGRHGVRPFAMVGVDGGDTYWHRRASGDDPIGMVVHELLPRMAALGLRTKVFGLFGFSMGGYGALLAAQRLGHRVTAVCAESPAVFSSYEAARGADPTAFDGRADFAKNDVRGGLDRLRHTPVWLGCGSSDPFVNATRRLRARLGDPAGGIERGCHDIAYWRSQLPAALCFMGRHIVG